MEQAKQVVSFNKITEEEINRIYSNLVTFHHFNLGKFINLYKEINKHLLFIESKVGKI